MSYHIVDLKRQNRLKVGTNKPKPKLKVKMQSVSDDNVRKRLLKQTRFKVPQWGQRAEPQPLVGVTNVV